MATDDQVKDEKLQYDINREAAKISALSSGKIDKYEYLTGVEILPSNQKQIIEQAKFTYSPLGKAFEKQTKTTEDQGEKQIKAIQNQGQIKTIKKYIYDDKDSPLILKQKRLKEITELNNKVSPDNLMYRYTGPTADAKFNEFDSALSLVDKIREGEINLANVKNDQKRFKSNLSKIKKVNKKILKCFIKQRKMLLNFMMIFNDI